MKVKVIGAGSIGNHLTQAFRRSGHIVTVVDRDPAALERMRTDIYPTRYGAWDDSIVLCQSDLEPRGGFDIIAIGTPPDARMKVAQAAIAEKPKAMLLEKPLCAADECHLLKEVIQRMHTSGILGFVGYDHAVAASAQFVLEQLRKQALGTVQTIDVEFREHWGGIFAAHPWLAGPHESYLGYTKRGGGASGEHSHALHLFLTFAQAAGWGAVDQVSSVLQVVDDGQCKYDSLATFTVTAENLAVGRVVQDVLTRPTRKWARIQGERAAIEWVCNGSPKGDVVRIMQHDGMFQEQVFEKKRPDDFYAEVQHIERVLSGDISYADSPINILSGARVIDILDEVWDEHGLAE